MKRTILLTVMALVAVSFAACTTDEPAEPEISNFNRLAIWMQGLYSSHDQSIADSSYFDIRLAMVRIWSDRTDGVWLYVEQAAASSMERPYRQRVYHLTQTDSVTFRSDVFTFEEPLRFAGVWKEASAMVALNPDSLTETTGCGIVLHKDSDSVYVGATVDKGCLNDWGEATYATSEVRITPSVLFSWDRGWNDKDEQVWGAEKGGYEFKRVM